MKQLAERFHVYMFDLPGMGASSRTNNYNQNATSEECISYFVDYVEKWRISLKLTNFYMFGHCFGAHILSHYVVKYPGHAIKLILASALGVRVAD